MWYSNQHSPKAQTTTSTTPPTTTTTTTTAAAATTPSPRATSSNSVPHSSPGHRQSSAITPLFVKQPVTPHGHSDYGATSTSHPVSSHPKGSPAISIGVSASPRSIHSRGIQNAEELTCAPTAELTASHMSTSPPSAADAPSSQPFLPIHHQLATGTYSSSNHSHQSQVSRFSRNTSVMEMSVSAASSWANSFRRATAFQFDREMTRACPESNLSPPSVSSLIPGARQRRGYSRHSRSVHSQLVSGLGIGISTDDAHHDPSRNASPPNSSFDRMSGVFPNMEDSLEIGRETPAHLDHSSPAYSRSWNHRDHEEDWKQPPIVDETNPLLKSLTGSLSMDPETDVLSDCESDNLHCCQSYDGDCHGLQAPDEMFNSKSSYYQSLFNSLNILMGVGLLTMPFSFKLTGWVVGVGCLLMLSLVTCHTAKILALCLDWTPDVDPSQPSQPVAPRPLASTFGDFGELAFGQSGRNFISFVFVLELCAATVALIILSADSILALFPFLDIVMIKIAIVALVVPATYPLTLNIASYGSLVGVVALLNLLVIVVFDGLTTTESPGSLLNPAETYIFPQAWYSVPLAFGLIMSGFCGHSVFPNLYRDMKEPEHYGKLVNHTYVVTTLTYLGIAAVGYAMFGSFTMQEITQNLPTVASYSPMLTQATIWLIALNPITKYALAISPVNLQIERYITNLFPALCGNSCHVPFTLRIMSRTFVSMCMLTIAILCPGFHNLMAILGSLFSCTVSIVFPQLCFLKLYGRKLTWWRYGCEVMVLVFGLVFGAIGTVWACLPGTVPDIEGSDL
ncbi:hypothetical protein BASA50_007321 [Batrachochytrium salamandrivorans]|uniref:Amino acid transporter transmembrane domain-containing protein n=1 Tax=Batrachochytrium salamandrivorans TaxID=1357716 RepID=A0ABQ8F7E2_9FUNG|nr:hypothetical protein BASA62_006196 [Batrachochytrium salamandrivorans]KAH6584214.1 hypothetical protein BASA60_001059 [Batrachochytrium salamandrivorans]KAH6593511.1 hypothetical protein BASA50_007321 [Batrachochytrium salamandrivorans]KAH9248623.1 hypothetical protein BASA81_013693 [Batrachochytrium salamandrivorans]KAH9265033.1 hypothetical protein BASA83_011457 [Batrachochytrium salamandrivorans]